MEDEGLLITEKNDEDAVRSGLRANSPFYKVRNVLFRKKFPVSIYVGSK